MHLKIGKGESYDNVHDIVGYVVTKINYVLKKSSLIVLVFLLEVKGSIDNESPGRRREQVLKLVKRVMCRYLIVG